MAVFLSPIGNEQIVDSNGAPLSGGQIFVYLAGTSTPATTWTSNTGMTAHSQPIILNTLGLPNTSGSAIWLTSGSAYKFVVFDSLGVLQRTIDNISGIGDTATSQDQWVVSGLTPTYINATSFSIPGDQTLIFQVGRRLNATVTAGSVYGTIKSSVFGSVTTVTLVMDGVSALDSGLSIVQLGLLQANPSAIPTPVIVTSTTGTSPTYLISTSPATNANTNANILVAFNAASIGVPATINVNNTGAKSLKQYNATGQKIDPNIAVGQRTNIEYDGTDWIIKNPLPQNVESQFNLSASVAANALTITLAAGSWYFRNSTLSTGGFSYVTTASDLTLTISSGSTLGTFNAVPSQVLVRVINDSGTLRLSAENIAGGMDASETGVISTTAEGGAGGADSATVIYSGTAVTNKTYRVAGVIRSTQATAGTWATSPSLVQGNGGLSLASMSSFGYGQTWQVFTVGVTRISGTTYYNTTGKPIQVAIVAAASSSLSMFINGVDLTGNAVNASSGRSWTPYTVPPGQSYATAGTITDWYELR